LRELDTGEVDTRTREMVSADYQNWTQHPNNTMV